MRRDVLIDTVGGELRYAVLEDGVLVSLDVDRGAAAVGDLQWGRVLTRLSHPAGAILSLSTGEEALLPDSACVGAPPLEGAAVLVQITRAAFDTKGPKATTRLSFEGRGLVFTPFNPEIRIGKKLADASERPRLADLLRRFCPEDIPGAGFTLRTAGAAMSDEGLRTEASVLIQRWRRVRGEVPEKLPALALKAPLSADRRVAGFDHVDRIAVDGAPGPVKARLAELDPSLAARVAAWHRPDPLFEAEAVEDQIDTALARMVPLPGGGKLIIEPTAALVAVDVDSGGSQDAVAVNAAAACACARQMRLRNLAGLIMVDVLKPDGPEQAAGLEGLWKRSFAQDGRTRVHGMTRAGVMELTRTRSGRALDELYAVGSAEAAAFRAARLFLRRQRREPGRRFRLSVSAPVAAAFQRGARSAWSALATGLGAAPKLKVDPAAAPDFVEVEQMP